MLPRPTTTQVRRGVLLLVGALVATLLTLVSPPPAAGQTETTVATVLIIDASGSMTQTSPGRPSDPDGRRLDASLAYLGVSVPGDEIGIVEFNSDATVLSEAVDVEANREALATAIDGIGSGGGTDLGAGLTAGCEVLGRAQAPRRAAIFLTDGQGGYDDEASCYAAQGWAIYSVGLGDNVSDDELIEMAAQTGGQYVPLATVTNLECEFQRIRARIAGVQAPPCETNATIRQDELLQRPTTVADPLEQISFSVFWEEGELALTATSPSGTSYDRDEAPGATVTTGDRFETITVPDPEAGEWGVEVLGVDVPGGEQAITILTLPVPPPNPPVLAGEGYWLLERSGAIHGFGDASSHAASGPTAVDLATAAGRSGLWVLRDDGTVRTLEAAQHHGDVDLTALDAGESVTAITVLPDGSGYWVVTDRGRVLSFGDADHHGDVSAVVLNGLVVDSAASSTGLGYFLVGADGGVFAFGDAEFAGSMSGRPLDAPMVGVMSDPDGGGYWLVAADGGVFSFDADFAGSMADRPLNAPMSAGTDYGDGYVLVAADGGVFNFSSRDFLGGLGADPPASPVVAIAGSAP